MKKILFFIIWIIPAVTWAQTYPGNVSSNIQVWLNANNGPQNGGFAAADGNAVDTWTDQSGARTNDATNNLSNASYGQPIFRSNTSDNINYNPVVDFGGSDGLDFGNDFVYSSGSGSEDGMTWIVIVQPDSTSSTKNHQILVDEGFFSNAGYGVAYGYSAYLTYTSTAHGGISTGRPSHSRTEVNTIARFEIDFGNTQSLTFDGDLSPFSSSSITLSKLDAATVNESATHVAGNGPLTIGAQSKLDGITNNDGRYLDGSIAEVIGYNKMLTATELRRVETYLAIKYGITLDNSDGGVAGDYEATDGTNIWDASVNSSYHNDLIGIGRDDNQGLLQLQSHTSDDSVRIYTDVLSSDNASNAGTVSNNLSYIIMGHNGNSKSIIYTEAPLSVVSKVEREWKITNTNFSDNYSIDIELDDASDINQNDLLLLVDTDTDFSDASYYTSVTMTKSGNHITISGLSTTYFPANATRYFTIGVKIAPGSVSDNLVVWLAADESVKTSGVLSSDGDDIDTWEDQSFARANAATNSLSDANYGQPTFRSNAADNINYNPVVDFDGADGLDFGNDYVFSSGTGTEDGMTWLIMVQPDSSSAAKTNQYLIDEGFYSNNGFGIGYGYSNFLAYTATNTGGVFSGFTDHSRGNTNTIARFEIDFGNTQTINVNGDLTPILSNNIPGLSDLNSTTINEAATHGVVSGPLTIGAQSKSDFITTNDGRYLDGSIAEVIGYNRVLSAAELRRVETYLALKYGISLDNSDGGVAGDYETSNGTNIWDASDNAVYHNDVIGIGRDDDTHLLQKQSHQANDTTRIYLSTLSTTNSANSGSFSSDDQFVVMGHNNGPAEYVSSTEYPTGAGIYSRIEREWKVTNTNFDGTFSLDIKLTSTVIDPTHLRLLIDTDGDFSDASLSSPTISYSGGVVTISGISTGEIPSGSTRYFTLASIDAGTPLPIELVYFSANADANNQVQLTWETASEINNDYFTIERSGNATNWAELKQVKGAGNSSGPIRYTTTDPSPILGTSFYRLKQTDYDGSYQHSEVRTVVVHSDSNSKIFVHPNPSTGRVTITGDDPEWHQFAIFNVSGQEMTHRIQILSRQERKLTLDISPLKAGTYFIRSGMNSYKLIKR